jgi:NADH dehydrogenase [ubiquinone] 1 alpha subcomplex assembly factor 7
MVPGYAEAVRVHLVEVSRTLRAKQAETLGQRIAAFHDQLSDLPEAPTLVIANEFFDALPVRQLVRSEQGWCERMVGYDPQADRLAFALGAPSRNAALSVPEPLRGSAEPGAVFELAPSALAIAHELGRRAAEHGSAAVIVDYGRSETRCEATLQAVRRHQRAEVLDRPGEADLTAHVDFPLLAQAARSTGAEVHGPVPQRDFLNGLGLDQRAEILKRQASAAQQGQIDRAHHRLTAADQMGTLFQALAIVPPGYGVPAGFPA